MLNSTKYLYKLTLFKCSYKNNFFLFFNIAPINQKVTDISKILQTMTEETRLMCETIDS